MRTKTEFKGIIMIIREYKTIDCTVMGKLFYDTVHTINAKDYTTEQLDAWSTGNLDLEAWNRSFLKNKGIRLKQKIRLSETISHW